MAAKAGQFLSLDEAFANVVRSRDTCLWPTRDTGRLEPFYEPVLAPRFRLKRGSTIFTIGSCFARNIEEHLAPLGFDIPMAGFGVPETEWPQRPFARRAGILNKYTPPSMLQEVLQTLAIMREPGAIDRLTDNLLYPLGGGMALDLELGGHIAVTRERAHERRRQVFEVFRRGFDADCVVVTLGLIECWFDQARQRFLQEAPNTPALRREAGRFVFKLLDLAETQSTIRELTRCLLQTGNPAKRILLTVSPVPLTATFSGMDVVIANGYGKSVLRAVAQSIRDEFDQVDYFPSYEMVTMSSDRSVWEHDLMHVTDPFVRRIVETFVRAYVEA
ncbi:MAG TPA: GSCFA domain-containing protein [Stellaceae bacterium]|nr:GSCFA domain-containing protein [Stellaceae bacterium]